MKRLFKYYELLLIIFIASCSSVQPLKSIEETTIAGVYIESNSTKRIEFYSNGDYLLYNPISTRAPVFERCEYSSKGKWSQIDNNIFQILSENYYIKQDGFDYNIVGEKRFSDDSLYLKIKFPTEFHPVKVVINFNDKVGNSILADKDFIVVPKPKHRAKNIKDVHLISLDLEADVSGQDVYRSRITFKIFENYINLSDSNYLIIDLPNFNRCFYEFEIYKSELLYLKNEEQLYWQGEIWNKSE